MGRNKGVNTGKVLTTVPGMGQVLKRLWIAFSHRATVRSSLGGTSESSGECDKVLWPGCTPVHLNEDLWGWDPVWWVLAFTRYSQRDSDVSEIAAGTSPSPKAVCDGFRCLIVSWLSHAPWLDMEGKRWASIIASCLSRWSPSSYWVLGHSGSTCCGGDLPPWQLSAPKCSLNLRSTWVLSTSPFSWGRMQSGMNPSGQMTCMWPCHPFRFLALPTWEMG